jgi:O-antigen/teichoic acid export membrane protein
VFSAAMLLIVPAGCLAGLMAAALMPFMLSEHLAEDILFAQAIMLVTPAVSLSLVLQTGAEATQDFFGANAMRAGTVLTVFFSLSVLLLTGSVTPYLAALSYSLAFLPVTVWLSVRLWRNIRPTLRGIKRSLGNTLRYALRCYTLDLIGTAAFYASQVAVVMLLAPAMVGYFFVALGVARIMEVTYTAVSTVLLPKTAGLERAEVVEKTIRAARLNLLGSAPVTLFLCLSAGTLIPLIYGKDFGSAVLLARILLAEVLLTGTTFILTQAFLALGRPRVPTLLNIVSLAATISGMVIAVPFMGATGVALVMLAVSCLKLTTVVACHVWLLEVPLRAFWFKSRDIDFVCGLFGRIRNSSAA